MAAPNENTVLHSSAEVCGKQVGQRLNGRNPRAHQERTRTTYSLFT